MKIIKHQSIENKSIIMKENFEGWCIVEGDYRIPKSEIAVKKAKELNIIIYQPAIEVLNEK